VTTTDTAPPVDYRLDGAVAVIRLQRPEAMNSLDRATKVALLQSLRHAAGDDAVRAVVLTGTGRAFSAGQDLREHVADLRAATDGDGGSSFALGSTVRDHYNPIATLIATMPKPVVAAVNGVAAGAGASFAFGCDVRVLGRSGGFNLAFSAIALSCDSGASWWLPRLIGVARAKDLLLFPRTVRADEALELGLANRVVPDDELADEALALARTLAAGPTAAYAAIRQAVAFAQSHDLAESLENEAELMDRTGASADHRGAVEAFVAKQQPTFQGR
jgi:2-(1,2-epoxy-1,2-dihydrophenyl)acetyl-CoA isomerase